MKRLTIAEIRARIAALTRNINRRRKRIAALLAAQRRDRAWRKQRRAQLKRRRSQRPKITRLYVTVDPKFGPLGPITAVTGHYTAGPRDTSDAHALTLWRSYHEQHARQGWGGIGYHYGITKAGTIVLLRPVDFKGAHTGGWNTGNVGVVCHGTTGDVPTPEQARTFAWLLSNAHTMVMPASHRVDLRGKVLRGHKDWPDNPTACPGLFHRMYLTGGKSR